MSDLAPTQDLILEVLAARHRLGEPHWHECDCTAFRLNPNR